MPIQVKHKASNASEKIVSFPGRLLFFVVFLLFFLCFLFGSNVKFVYICQQKLWNRFLGNEKNMSTNESIKKNDLLGLAKQGFSTFYNIAQMARYRYLYTLGKESQDENSINNTIELEHNRTKMIKYTCLAGLGILGLLAIGICGLSGRE